ncbi:NADP-dependent isopropanol dehydrogenase [Stieleria maiorica]|uniref:NADP-dependent isopropanol dehydrogenase n=1 Tax=Stieleria maiorica TaxID=2795974 RepID=A0A5B9MAU2_9BACT|nr:alcohol dehydrogenase catalytic domain-containing protein [Stieleria maiorica]QEF98258.1 NADP-dependent isopropanol dehydrogenase [Stieleria maiorica]
MRAVCFQSVRQVAVQEIADATLEAATDAVVQVEVAGLCGSDLHPYFGRESGLDPGTVMGHEFVGRVVEVGDQVRSVAIGDRVCSPFTTNCGTCFYCRRGLSSRCPSGQLFGWRQKGVGLHGGQSERVRVPLADGTLMKIPDGIDPVAALLLGDNLSTGYFGASLAVDPSSIGEDAFAVVGCGTVGLLAIASARRMGARNIYAIDPNTARLQIAERLGAAVFNAPEDALSAVRSATDGRGADGVMEFVGLPEAQALAYRLIRPGGRMSVIGCHCTPNFAFSPADAYDKNLTYRTGRCPARSYMDVLPETLATEPMDFSWCVTHRFGVDDAEEAYQTFAGGKDGCVKAVLDFT